MSGKFRGFPKHNGKGIPLPTTFFSDLLPLIDDLAELKLTLFCFRALFQKEGQFRYLRRRDFQGDAGLLQSLAEAAESEPDVALNVALAKAAERGTILCVDVRVKGASDTLYFLNTANGRAAVEQIELGAWQPDGDSDIELLPERPNVYRLYEDNIGPLTPMIAEALKDAQAEYPAHWMEEAMRAAVENNARSWRYILKVLERWRTEGRSRDFDGRRSEQNDPGDGRRYVSGKYADYIEH